MFLKSFYSNRFGRKCRRRFRRCWGCRIHGSPRWNRPRPRSRNCAAVRPTAGVMATPLRCHPNASDTPAVLMAECPPTAIGCQVRGNSALARSSGCHQVSMAMTLAGASSQHSRCAFEDRGPYPRDPCRVNDISGHQHIRSSPAQQRLQPAGVDIAMLVADDLGWVL